MYALLCTAGATTALLVASVVSAADPASANAAAAQNAVAPAAAASAPQAAPQATTPAATNQSRYRRHNGRWWYSMPNNSWVVWQNNAWVPYTAGMFAGDRNMASNNATRRYSYAPGSSGYPRVFRTPRASGDSRSIRYAGSKANFDYAPYTGGSVQ
ncbi:MAG TPA: hypothetical protein VGG64_05515 [Pirellulales bacterium]